MSVRIAIPEPTSSDSEYNSRSFPAYISALQSTGAIAVPIPLHESPQRIAHLLDSVQGILLPGSRYDADPQKYDEEKIAACNEADPAREAVDEILLQHAFNIYKPVLGICYGIQSLAVWCNGSLIQDLAAEGKTAVNHSPGRTVLEAHSIQITPNTLLSRLANGAAEDTVNSSHHQALRNPGNNLKIAAISPQDGIIEAVELNSPDHFVLGVQWHPERTYTTSELSRAIFRGFVHAAEAWKPREIRESVAAAE